MTVRLVLVSIALLLAFLAQEWLLRPVIREWKVVTFRWQCWKFRRALQQLQVEKLDRELAALRSV